MRQKC